MKYYYSSLVTTIIGYINNSSYTKELFDYMTVDHLAELRLEKVCLKLMKETTANIKAGPCVGVSDIYLIVIALQLIRNERDIALEHKIKAGECLRDNVAFCDPYQNNNAKYLNESIDCLSKRLVLEKKMGANNGRK